LRKSFMSMVEKILELDILIIYGALTFLVWMNLFQARVNISQTQSGS
jgi:hypothetical protein